MTRKLITWTVKDLRETIQNMVGNKFDCIMFIEGRRGLGKSTLAWKILHGLEIPQPFKPHRDLVYSRDDTLRQLATKKGGCILSDEMINVAYNRDFYNEEQKTLLKAFNMYRDSCNVFVGCIPRFVDLDIQIQKLCKVRITVLRRGIALIHTQNRVLYSTDVWDIKNNQKIESKWSTKGTKNPRYAQLTTVRGIMRFGDLPPAQRETYEAIKAEKRAQVFSQYTGEQQTEEDKFNTQLLLQAKEGKLTTENLILVSQLTGKSVDTLRKKINDQLKQEGSTITSRELVMTEKKREKRDKLGFKLPSLNNGFKPKEAHDESFKLPTQPE